MNNLGPLSGGVQPAAPARTVIAYGGESGASLLARTLSRAAPPAALSSKQTTSRLGQLLDANRIRDPRKIKAGATIRAISG